MTNSTATAEISASAQSLQDYFEHHAQAAFDQCWDAHCKADFHAKLLADVQKGRVLSDELPEAQGLSPSVLRAVIQKQQAQALASVESAWELPAEIASEFRTTIRSALPASETVPQYDIEYQAKNTQKSAKITIKTWRRNITVNLLGCRAALDELNGLVTFATLKG